MTNEAIYNNIRFPFNRKPDNRLFLGGKSNHGARLRRTTEIIGHIFVVFMRYRD